MYWLIAGLAVLPASAQQNYVLEAANWSERQTRAVHEAGGFITFSHKDTGIGVVQSFAPGFLVRALGSGAFTRGTEDMVVQWQKPVPTVDAGDLSVNFANDQFINLQWNHRAVNAPGAWAAGYDGSGVRVAIVDGGLHADHTDLAQNVELASCRSFVPGFNFNQDTGTFWHGTHVAGIVGAVDNTIGVVGLAPRATLIGVKVLHNGSGSFGWIIAGLLYAATPVAEGGAGADIINMSLGSVFPRGGGNTGAGPLVAAMNRAVNYASRYALVVSAAGNDGLDLDHQKSLIAVPAESGAGIAVSSTGPVGYAVGYPNGATDFSRMASYTNYGNSVIHVAAPGGDFALPGNALCTLPVTGGTITNFCWAFDMVLSTSRGTSISGSYSWAAGTSMAAPAASAVAALIKQRFPMISVSELKNRLARSADDLGKPGADPFYGRGFVNAYRAVTQ